MQNADIAGEKFCEENSAIWRGRQSDRPCSIRHNAFRKSDSMFQRGLPKSWRNVLSLLTVANIDMQIDLAGWEIRELSEKATAGKAWVTQALCDIRSVRSVIRFSEELTTLARTAPNLNRPHACAIYAARDDDPALNDNR